MGGERGRAKAPEDGAPGGNLEVFAASYSKEERKMRSDAKERKGAGSESGQRCTRGLKGRRRRAARGAAGLGAQAPRAQSKERDVGETVNTGSGAERGTGAG